MSALERRIDRTKARLKKATKGGTRESRLARKLERLKKRAPAPPKKKKNKDNAVNEAS